MDDLTVLMRDLLGFRYIERLLAEPGREVHVFDLVSVERGARVLPGRLAEVDDDIEEARPTDDISRSSSQNATGTTRSPS